MAVRISTTSRACLNCKINSDANAGKEFHEIFDEVGLELQLPFLVETFFHIDVNKTCKQHLCDDCVNTLIELYDRDEHVKEERCKANNLENNPECSNSEENSKYSKNESGTFRYESENFHEPFLIDQNNTQFTLPKSNSAENTNFKTFVSTHGENAVEIHIQNKSEYTDYENIEYIFSKIRSAPFTQQQNFPDNDFDQAGESQVSQGFNISFSSCAIRDQKSEELNSNEHIEIIIDDGNQNLKINKQSNTNRIGSKKLEMEEFQIKSNEEIRVPSEIESKTKEKGFFYSDQNEFVEENVCDEFINNGDSNSLVEEDKISEEEDSSLLNVSYEDDLIEQEDITDGSYSLEEDYLIDELNFSGAYDQVDLNEYLDKVLITKFQDLQLNWDVECKLCLQKYFSFEELLNHQCLAEFEKEQTLACIIKDCEEDAKDLPTLARHLILTHYDKLESTAIHGKCRDCQQTFSSVIDFNKHSCCRKLKRKTGTPNYCKYCDLNFQSFERVVFHMQFHLKDHRPKICLLCGDIFNNSDDFFKHTQYTHNPKTVSAYERCDRLFNYIQAFNNMENHDGSKYQLECALCPKTYTSKLGFTQHMDIYHNIKLNALQCEYCPRNFSNTNSYRNHMKSHATDAKVQTFICSTCGLTTNKMEMIKDHIESDNKSPCFSSPVDKKILGLCYSCVNCSLDFYTMKHVKDHHLSDSHSNDLFHCGLCRKSFNSFRHMRNHFIKHKDLKEWQKSFPITRHFVCNIKDCSKFYAAWVSLYHHKKRVHKSEEETNSSTELKCQFCHNLYSSQQSLSDHVARSHNNVLAKIKCSHCIQSFNSENRLQKHIDKCHIPVECDICFKQISNRRNLQTHMNTIHYNRKRYSCKHCQKGYFTKKERTVHEKKFHPKKNLKCKLCNFVTTYPKSLEIHMDKHNNRLKFKCSRCGKSFGRKQKLEFHLERHQNNKDFICARYLNGSSCDAAFLSFNLLKKHIETKHKYSSFSIDLKREKLRKKDHDDVQIENVSDERSTCDNSSVYEKPPQTSYEIYFIDEDFEQDAFISTLENDMEFEEQKPDTESLKI